MALQLTVLNDLIYSGNIQPKAKYRDAGGKQERIKTADPWGYQQDVDDNGVGLWVIDVLVDSDDEVGRGTPLTCPAPPLEAVVKPAVFDRIADR